MYPEVALLAADSGELVAVTGCAVPGGRFTALFLEFKAGTLKLVCDDDTDEIVASVVEGGLGHQDVSHPALVDLTGLTLDYVWELRNHRGYVDGFQLRLRDGRGREETRQFEVGASAMDVCRVVP
jgi:Family of unknown function (DUF6334)